MPDLQQVPKAIRDYLQWSDSKKRSVFDEVLHDKQQDYWCEQLKLHFPDVFAGIIDSVDYAQVFFKSFHMTYGHLTSEEINFFRAVRCGNLQLVAKALIDHPGFQWDSMRLYDNRSLVHCVQGENKQNILTFLFSNLVMRKPTAMAALNNIQLQTLYNQEHWVLPALEKLAFNSSGYQLRIAVMQVACSMGYQTILNTVFQQFTQYKSKEVRLLALAIYCNQIDFVKQQNPGAILAAAFERPIIDFAPACAYATQEMCDQLYQIATEKNETQSQLSPYQYALLFKQRAKVIQGYSGKHNEVEGFRRFTQTLGMQAFHLAPYLPACEQRDQNVLTRHQRSCVIL